MFRALEQLYALGALNDKGELTTMGKRVVIVGRACCAELWHGLLPCCGTQCVEVVLVFYAIDAPRGLCLTGMKC